MTLRKLTAIPFMAIALLAVGCGDDCESGCEDAKECEGASDLLKALDCEKVCEDADKFAEDAGCEDEWDDFVSCGSDDACNEEACASENTKFNECTEKFCTDNPDHERCSVDF